MLEIVDAKSTLEKLRIQNIDLARKILYSAKSEYSEHPIMKRLIARALEKYEALMKQRMGWERWEQRYTAMYDELYTYEELKGLLAFFRTDAGRALIRTTPIIASRTQASAVEAETTMEANIQEIMASTEQEVTKEIEEEERSARTK